MTVAVTKEVVGWFGGGGFMKDDHRGDAAVGLPAGSDEDLDGQGPLFFLIADVAEPGLLAGLPGFSDLGAQHDGNARWQHPKEVEVKLFAGQVQKSLVRADRLPDVEIFVDI